MSSTKTAASTEGTLEYANKFSHLGPNAFCDLGASGWKISRLGFGGYRITDADPTHEAALAKALNTGCNLIDTSTNYADGGSERLVGKALNQSKFPRESFVVVSKVGYVQGENLKEALKLAGSAKGLKDVVEVSSDCWHCIHPDYISSQLDKSLARTGLKTIDVYLLHNPEYFLSEAHNPSAAPTSNKEGALEPARVEFYRRIRASFERLEEEVQKGRIQSYGVSSNTFGLASDHPEMASVKTMWEISEAIAKENGSENHFAVIQLPANLLESGPALEANNAGETALEFAQSKGLGVLANRPLNAFGNQRLFRLADFPEVKGAKEIEPQLGAVKELEEKFVSRFAHRFELPPGTLPMHKWFNWAVELTPWVKESVGREAWDDTENQIRGQSHYLLAQLSEAFKDPDFAPWKQEYVAALEDLLSAFRAKTTRVSRLIGAALSEVVDPFMSEKAQKESLSRKAINVLLSTPGVHCVLNGMRSPEYVEDSMGALALEPLDKPLDVFKAYRAFLSDPN